MLMVLKFFIPRTIEVSPNVTVTDAYHVVSDGNGHYGWVGRVGGVIPSASLKEAKRTVDYWNETSRILDAAKKLQWKQVK